jgi:hypothetical protein
MEVVKNEETVDFTLSEKNDKAAPPRMPKIVVCPKYDNLKMVQAEFVAQFGAFAVGVVVITLDEAIRLELPLRKAIEDYSNQVPNDVYLTNTVEELIPEDYKDTGFTMDIGKMVAEFKRVKPQRNDSCPCASGKKFKNCCISL